MRVEYGQDIYDHEEINYDLQRPTIAWENGRKVYEVEAWSPIYPDFPYDSDGAESTYIAARFYANQWMLRFPDYYAIIIRGPEGATVYRELTSQSEEGA